MFTTARQITAAATIALAALGAAPAAADGPGVGAPTLVQVGDSVSAGEGGRWAGNTKLGSWRVDALGASAYHDTAAGESIPGCHRSKSAPIHIGGGVQSANLACSGAKTLTYGTGAFDKFKPGIDFYLDAQGRMGQARALQLYAAKNNVKAVVVTIGANNYGFGDVVGRCVSNFVSSPSWAKNLCSDDDDMTSRFGALRQSQETYNVYRALLNIRQAMTSANYTASQYSIIVQTYWSPLPRGADFRYSESQGQTRQSTGGCGFWDRDADWANDVVVPALNATLRSAVAKSALPNVRILDLQGALGRHRLCDRNVVLVEEKPQTCGFCDPVMSWTHPYAVTYSEWVAQIRLWDDGPYQQQESLHASYWGQLAVRNCLRLAYNAGNARSGRCEPAAGRLNSRGEPEMGLW